MAGNGIAEMLQHTVEIHRKFPVASCRLVNAGESRAQEGTLLVMGAVDLSWRYHGLSCQQTIKRRRSFIEETFASLHAFYKEPTRRRPALA